MPVVKHGDEAGQVFDLAEGHPIMPENFVPFYKSFIPVACRGDPTKLAAAMKALEARDQYGIERAMYPDMPTPPWER